MTQGDHWISLVSLGRAMLQSASNFSVLRRSEEMMAFVRQMAMASATVMRLTRLCAAEQADVQKM